MNIELRKVKYAAFASEETACFEAAVYINGKDAGTVRNDGKGGCNFYQPLALEDQLQAHAKTLPAETWQGHTIPVSADMVIGNLLDEHLARRDLKRLLASGIVIARDHQIYHTRIIKGDLGRVLESMVAQPSEQVLEKWNAHYILNLMEFEQALRLFRESGAQ